MRPTIGGTYISIDASLHTEISMLQFMPVQMVGSDYVYVVIRLRRRDAVPR